MYFICQPTGGSPQPSVVLTSEDGLVIVASYDYGGAEGTVGFNDAVADISRIDAASVTPNSPAYEKSNSRSSAPVFSGQTNFNQPSSTKIVASQTHPFSYVRWTASYRTSVYLDINSFAVYKGNRGVWNATLSFGQNFNTRKGRKTIRRGGYWPLLGNYVHNHQKTGGSAFQIHVPHFHNDILFLDPSQWKHGFIQSDVWNINLFGTAPTPSARNRAHSA